MTENMFCLMVILFTTTNLASYVLGVQSYDEGYKQGKEEAQNGSQTI